MPFHTSRPETVRVHMLSDGNNNRIYSYRNCARELKVRFESPRGQTMDVADSEEELQAVIDFLQDQLPPATPTKKKRHR